MRKKIKFINCKIDISKKVFIPEIETEFWVKKAIKDLGDENLEILDIFSGSGCVGTALLKAKRNVRVNFLDIDEEAIKQIKINLRLNKISKKRYRIYQSNLFDKIRKNKYDIIFANPPYVALDKIYEVQKDVLEKDPRTALFGGKDGMIFIKKFLHEVGRHLKPHGKIFMEFDPFQKKEIEKILKNRGFKFFFRKDQFGKYRWLKAETK